MIAAVIAVSAALAMTIPAIIWSMYRLDHISRELLTAADLRQKQFEAAEGYIHERDELTKHCAELEDLNRSLKMRIVSQQSALEAARGEYANAIADKIKRGTVADAARDVDELLKAPLPGPTEGPAGSDGGP